MYDLTVLLAWLEFTVRWSHVIFGIAWIGSSFYFIALDLGLRQTPDLPKGAFGEEWQVHGGGFYHIQKYLVAPEKMPDHLTWFKWESYATWMSGFALLILVYYLGAELYLIDPNVADLSLWQAIAISSGSLVFGWYAYHYICLSKFGDNNTRLMIFLFGVLVLMAWGYTQVFSGRAALLHLGAFTATIMSANVFLLIIPNQRIVVADLIAGKRPDPKYGKIAKQRSTHNNYLTLPVLFLMLSNHYPLAFASEMNWLIASLIFLVGVLIRHYFNSNHSRSGNPTWTWLAAAVLMIVIAWLSSSPMFQRQSSEVLGPQSMRFAQADGFDQVHEIIQGRCSMCHTAEPAWDGIAWPPKGVRFDTAADVARNAKEIYLQAGVTNAMPPANLSYMETAERDLIVAWYKAAVAGGPLQVTK